jgi:hypothetical protein
VPLNHENPFTRRHRSPTGNGCAELSVILGVMSSFVGIALAYVGDLPSGAAMHRLREKNENANGNVTELVKRAMPG